MTSLSNFKEYFDEVDLNPGYTPNNNHNLDSSTPANNLQHN